MWKSYHNNPVESDIKIVLRDGIIHAHRLVLRASGGAYFNMILDRKKDELAFPDHSDHAVKTLITYVYGCTLEYNMTFEQWHDTIELAYVTTNDEFVKILTNNVPDDIDLLSAIQLAYLHDNDELMRVLTDDVMTHGKICTGISVDEYDRFRSAWMVRGHDLLGLITMDCQYCDNMRIDLCVGTDNNEDLEYVRELLSQYLMTIDFKLLSADDIQQCATLPLIVDMPLVSYLMKILPQSRPAHVFGDLDMIKKEKSKTVDNRYGLSEVHTTSRARNMTNVLNRGNQATVMYKPW